MTMSYHMSPDEFRHWGHRLIDWIADYRENISDYPVLSQVQPGEIRKALPTKAPIEGETFEAMLRDVEQILLPGLTHWQSPNFFAYFPSNSSEPAVLGDLLSSGLGVQGMIWATSPACTELETLVLDWIVDMLDLPETFKSSGHGGGVIQDTASSATLCALLAARERATSLESNRRGVRRSLVAYTSSHAHSSIEKACKIAGIGKDNLRLIEVDAEFAMSPQALSRRITDDRNEERIPFFVTAAVGTTSSLAVDPIEAIGRICSKEKIWLHVDAAMSGTAALCPEFRGIHEGLNLADSYTFNPHKWMFTTFDCNCFYVSDRRALTDALAILPEYLRNAATSSGKVFDYRDWHIQLGRRFRALKLWFVIRHYGVQGLQYHIRRHVELAKEFANWVQRDERFEIVAPVRLNLVCFRHRGGDEVNEALLERLNESGKLYLTHTKLDGQFTLRLSVGQTRTEREHVKAAWEQIQAMAPT